MTQDELKQQVAEAALKYVEDDAVVGVGSEIGRASCRERVYVLV